jgi:hypothetical protein
MECQELGLLYEICTKRSLKLIVEIISMIGEQKQLQEQALKLWK